MGNEEKGNIKNKKELFPMDVGAWWSPAVVKDFIQTEMLKVRLFSAVTCMNPETNSVAFLCNRMLCFVSLFAWLVVVLHILHLYDKLKYKLKRRLFLWTWCRIDFPELLVSLQITIFNTNAR